MSGKYPWQEDEGETGYPNYQMAYGGYQPEAAPSYAQTPAPQSPSMSGLDPSTSEALGMGAKALSLPLDAIGTGLKAYGAYRAYKDAGRDYQDQRDAYAFDKEIGLEDRQRAEEERRRRAELEAGNYATNYLDRAVKSYGQYRG